MNTVVKPGAVMRRGAQSLAADAVKFLVENKAEVEKLLDGIDERCAAAMKAIAAQETRYDSLDAWDSDLTQREADLETREADYAPRVKTLAKRETEIDTCVEGMKAVVAIDIDLPQADFDRAMQQHAQQFGLPRYEPDTPTKEIQ